MLWVQFYYCLGWIDLRHSSRRCLICKSECFLASSDTMPYFHIYQGGANLEVCHSTRSSIWAMQDCIVLVMPCNPIRPVP